MVNRDQVRRTYDDSASDLPTAESSSSILSSSLRRGRARSNSRRPAAVGWTPRPVRVRSVSPRWASSFLILVLAAGWLMFRRLAAAERPDSLHSQGKGLQFGKIHLERLVINWIYATSYRIHRTNIRTLRILLRVRANESADSWIRPGLDKARCGSLREAITAARRVFLASSGSSPDSWRSR